MVHRGLIPLTTAQLEYLATVDRHDTWAEASEALGVTPSALSQGLGELERRLGVTLFERSGRSRVLTPDGRQAVAHAGRILAAIADLTSWAQATSEGRGGVARLGLIDIAAVHHYPEVLKAFRSQRPDVELRLTVGASAALLAQVQAGALDAAVLVEPRRVPDDIVSTPALIEDLAVYGPDGADDDPTHWGPWITFPPESHTRAHIARVLRRLGAEFRVEAESHQPEVLRQMVQLGMGWTVLPVLQAEADPNPLQRSRPEPLFQRNLVVVQRAGVTPSPAVADLIDLILAVGADEVQPVRPR